MFPRLGGRLVDEDSPYRDAYRLQRMVDGNATTIATFYSLKGALTIIPSLDNGYRLMLGDKRRWPNEASSGPTIQALLDDLAKAHSPG